MCSCNLFCPWRSQRKNGRNAYRTDDAEDDKYVMVGVLRVVDVPSDARAGRSADALCQACHAIDRAVRGQSKTGAD